MAEGVQLGGVGIFADKGSPGVGDSFGDADHHVGAFLEGLFQVMIEGFQLEGRFREIDEEGIIAFKFPCQAGGGRQPSGVASHDLHNGYRLLLINGGVQNNFPDGGGHIAGGASKAGSMVRKHQVVVDGFGDPDKADGTFGILRIAGQLIHRIHGIVSADIKKIADVHFLEIVKNSGVHLAGQILRELIAAGTQIRGGRQL